MLFSDISARHIHRKQIGGLDGSARTDNATMQFIVDYRLKEQSARRIPISDSVQFSATRTSLNTDDKIIHLM